MDAGDRHLCVGSWLNRRCGGRFPSDGQSAFDAGASAFGRGDLEQAEAGFRAAMYEDPEDLSSISNLGMVVRTILSTVTSMREWAEEYNVMIMSRGCIRKERPRNKYALALFPLLLGDDFGHYLIGVVFICCFNRSSGEAGGKKQKRCFDGLHPSPWRRLLKVAKIAHPPCPGVPISHSSIAPGRTSRLDHQMHSFGRDPSSKTPHREDAEPMS